MDISGQNIGQYRIIEPIGAGGMATVFKAYQPGLDRYVAIKVLPAQHALTPGFKERFIHEAKAVAQLSHPNILPIYDVGLEGDLSYFVMKYVPDHTLSQLMGQPLSLLKARRYIDQMAGALDHAHRRGILHRDIKPSNMLVEKEEDWLLLADFGLAKIVEGSVVLTGSGAIMGTPAYISPEQAGGKPVDRRTDIYSLGIVLYEMVTGRVPYKGETPMGVIVKHLVEPLPLPRSLNPDLPEDVERVILKALAKEPDDRYGWAGELAEALRQAVHASATQPVAHSLPAPLSTATAPDIQAATSPDLPDQTVPGQPEATILSEPKVEPHQPRWRWVVSGLLVLIVVGGGIFFATRGEDRSVEPDDSSSGQAAAGPVSAGTPTSTPRPPTPIPSSTLIPTVVNTTRATSPEGVLATITATAPVPTDTSTPTDTPLPPSPTPTLAPPTLTSMPIPTIDVDPTVYDNFNNPANDGAFNQNQWVLFSSSTTEQSIQQQDGVLIISFDGLSNNQVGLDARKYQNFKISAPTFFEAKLMVGDEKPDYHVFLFLSTDLYSSDFASCLFRSDWKSPDVHCVYSERHERTYKSKTIDTEFGIWHTVRIDIDPSPMTFTYYVDGQVVGTYTSINAEELKEAKFTLSIGVFGPGTQTFSGYIDDVRVGQIGQ